MQQILYIFLCLALVGWNGGDDASPDVMEGYVVVKFKSPRSFDGASKTGWSVFDEAAGRLEVKKIRQLFQPLSRHESSKLQGAAASLQGIHEVRFSAPVSPRIASALLAQDPNVEYAEPRYIYTLSGTESSGAIKGDVWGYGSSIRLAPNDPQFAEMDHLRYIGMPEAWDVVKASDENVLVAIVDAGTDWRHPDLQGNIWFNTGEVDGNGVDDDNNGYVDDVRGWNFADNSNDPSGLDDTPANGRHGTMVTGIAGAVTDNGTGIAGASWNARILPINVACPETDNSVCFGFDGILYAALLGADVINVSWGGPESRLGRDVVRAASDLGSLLIVSAGNNGSGSGQGGNIDVNPAFPAAYDRVLVVGSTGKSNDTKAGFSNYGLSVDVFAPGVTLNSIVPGGGYTTEASGTSFSTPLVVSIAALLRTLHPGWSIDQIREQIRVTSDPIDSFNPAALNGLLGKGRVNAERAINETSVPAIRIQELSILDSGSDGTVQSGENVQLNLALINYLADANNLTFSLTSNDPNVNIQNGTVALGALGSDASTAVQFSFRMSSETPNDHLLLFRLEIEGDGYEDADFIRLIANRVTHSTDAIDMSLTDRGNIGWTGFQGSSGQGFRFLGIDWLFEGGLLVGTSEERVSDGLRNSGDMTRDDDFQRSEGSFFGVVPGEATSEAGLVILNDDEATNPVGIRVHQESYADVRDENQNFILLRYVLTPSNNSGEQAINNMYVGLFCDWDLTIGGDFARFDGSRRMGYVQSSPEDPLLLIGSRLLTLDGGLSYRSIDNEELFDSRAGGDGFTDTEKWSFLTGGIQTREVDNTDVSTMLAAGPFRIESGASREIAFALIAAVGTEDFFQAADRAQQFWNETIRNLEPNPVNVEEFEPSIPFRSGPPYPNPIRSFASFDLHFSTPGTTNLSIYDILGREVYRSGDESHSAGIHRIQWDARNQRGFLVPDGLYIARIRAVLPHNTYSATHKFIVMR